MTATIGAARVFIVRFPACSGFLFLADPGDYDLFLRVLSAAAKLPPW
jgi:hypothetical protein